MKAPMLKEATLEPKTADEIIDAVANGIESMVVGGRAWNHEQEIVGKAFLAAAKEVREFFKGKFVVGEGKTMIAPPGLYLHGKTGNKYRVLGLAIQADNKARPDGRDVIYMSLETGEVFTRDQQEFEEVVKWSDGEMRSRFIMMPNK